MTGTRWEATPDDLFDDQPELPQEDNAAPAAGEQTILDKPEREAARELWDGWHAQEPTAHARNVETEVNRRRRRGDRYVGVQKAADKSEWRVWSAPQNVRTPPSLNKSARLARRTISVVFTDQPVPDATPSTDHDDDRAAAEFTTRWLQSYGAEGGLNIGRRAFQAMNLASTFRSTFLHFYVHPAGGGSEAATMLASPAAQTVQDATHVTQQMVQPDPVSGLPTLVPVQVPQPGPFVTRYVTADGRLTDKEAEAQRLWKPAIKVDLLTSRNVRFLPEACDGIDDAEGVYIVLPATIGALKAQFPKLAELSNEQLRKLVDWRPEHHKYLLPGHLTEDQLQGSQRRRKTETVPDDAMAFVLTFYQLPCPYLPEGANVTVIGEDFVAQREPLSRVNGDRRVDLPLPLAQYRQFREGDPDPMGFGLMDLLGSGDELLQSLLGSIIEHIDRFNNRKTFVPLTSSFQPQQGYLPTGSYVPISPGGQPITEDVPDYPRSGFDFATFVKDELNDESGLQEAGQGLDTPNVSSGFHASLVMERVQSALAELHQHAQDGLMRSWRVMLSLARAYFPDPQLMKTLGDDQTWKFDHWSSTDFRDTTDVRVQRGSFTMLSPSQKAVVAQNMGAAQMLDPQQVKRITMGNVGGLIAAQDDPFWLEIMRQIAQWEKGPEAQPQTPGAPAGVDPMTGAPTPPLPPGPQSPFPVEPHHDEPAVALVRHYELARKLASTSSHKFGPEWRAVLIQAYTEARTFAAMAAAPAVDAEGNPVDPNADPNAPAGEFAPAGESTSTMPAA